MNKDFKPLHEQIAEKLIAELEAGTSPFQKPWTDFAEPAFTIPVNPTTGKNYRGLNSLWLAMQGHADPRWMTLKQASFAGYTVEKGAKATLISFVKTHHIEVLRDENGEKIKDEGVTRTNVTELEKPLVTKAFVFNAEQIAGIAPLADFLQQKRELQQWEPVERAESLLAQSKAVISHGGNEAYYSKFKDVIQLPLRQQFDNPTLYYAVALHELGHWTGHETRLNRQMEGPFGSEKYAREELRAEIASLMIGSELNIGHNFGGHAAYVANWVKILKDEPFELFRAAADAQKIFDFVMALEQKLELKQTAAPNKTLSAGESIVYNHNVYTVTDKKGKTLKMEDMDGKKFTLKTSDGLYESLVQARNHPPEPELVLDKKLTHKISMK